MKTYSRLRYKSLYDYIHSDQSLSDYVITNSVGDICNEISISPAVSAETIKWLLSKMKKKELSSTSIRNAWLLGVATTPRQARFVKSKVSKSGPQNEWLPRIKSDGRYDYYISKTAARSIKAVMAKIRCITTKAFVYCGPLVRDEIKNNHTMAGAEYIPRLAYIQHKVHYRYLWHIDGVKALNAFDVAIDVAEALELQVEEVALEGLAKYINEYAELNNAAVFRTRLRGYIDAFRDPEKFMRTLMLVSTWVQARKL